MPASDVALVNRALRFLGQAPITSLDDGTAPANIAADLLPDTRDAVLRMHPWNCATFLASLPALVEAPPWGWARQFELPAGPEPPFCLRVLRLENEAAHDKHWRVFGRRIYSDEPAPLHIVYIGRVTNVGALDPLLADAMAARLAHDMAYAITASDTKVQQMRELFEALLTEARRVDAREQSQDERIVSTQWLSGRYGAPPLGRGGGGPF